jgi:hypothetical protein
MSKVTKPIGMTQHTCQMIMLYLATIGRPARTSEIRKAVVEHSPASTTPIYGCLGDLQTAGEIRRLTHERDALFALRG